MYHIHITFDLKFEQEIQKSRQNHLLYIEKTYEKILFGGVLENKDEIKSGIVYVVKFDSFEASYAFLSKDPYFKYIKKYQINKFLLKINKND